MSARPSSVVRIVLIAVILIGLGVYLVSRAGWSVGAWFGSPRPNIVLISVDTCRADHLGCYNPSKKTTPNIDAFAQTATLFENVVSPVPITLPSHSSMLTGHVPAMHGARTNKVKLADEIVTLPELLKPEGYTTGAIVSAFVLDGRFGLSQGFDTYDDRFRVLRTRVSSDERVGQEASTVAIQWLRQRRPDERFFLFLHYFDPHWPYEAPEPFPSRFPGEPYSAEVAYADYCVGQVLDELKRRELFDNALIIIVGDHGEMLGEHGELSHQFFIYESAIKVPLIVKLPGQEEPRRVEDVVGLVDIAPTLCSLLGLRKENADGIDLSPYLKGQSAPSGAEDRYVYSESVVPQSCGANPLFAQVGRRWKYIHTTRPELYDLVADPQEQTDLVEAEPHRARRLAGRVTKLLARAAGARVEGDRLVLDEEARRRLESLGYVDVTEHDTLELDATREDAKDVIRFHVAYQEAMKLRWDGHHEEALERFRRITEEKPDMREPHVMAAQLLAELGRYEESLKHLTVAIRLNPEDPRQYAERGLIYEALGDDENALADYAKALERPPVDPQVYNLRAKVLARRGEVAAAVEDLERAKEAFPPGSEGWTAAEKLRTQLAGGSGKVDLSVPLPRSR